ncbi:MAG TPA: hypothetical protein VF618_05600 [Thermoanaerobaculia bacterium]
MKRIAWVLSLLVATSVIAQPRPEAQLAAMKKLDGMVGVWKGEGWIEMGGPRLAFRGSETVQRKLHGVALLVEGAFFAKPPGAEAEVPVHTTLAVISFDPKSAKYAFSTWLATGTSGDHELVLRENGWQWQLQTPGGATVRYTTTFANGQWVEVGERSTDGTTWKQFFEMKLKKE